MTSSEGARTMPSDLARRLLIRAGGRVAYVDPPPELRVALQDLPPRATIHDLSDGNLQVVVVFVRAPGQLVGTLAGSAAALAPHGILWVAWPAGRPGRPSPLHHGRVRQAGIDAGLAPASGARLTDDWSALSFRAQRGLAPTDIHRQDYRI